jgi:hypothetical protein
MAYSASLQVNCDAKLARLPPPPAELVGLADYEMRIEFEYIALATIENESAFHEQFVPVHQH